MSLATILRGWSGFGRIMVTGMKLNIVQNLFSIIHTRSHFTYEGRLVITCIDNDYYCTIEYVIGL
jgi:dUTPase